MKRILFALVCFLSFSQVSFASLYAILPCHGETQARMVDKCVARDLTVVSASNNESFVLVDVISEDQLVDFCYYAEVRQLEHHLCFNTNKLLVKLSNSNAAVIEAHDLKAHPSIPNLYYAFPTIDNEAQLLEAKASLEALNGVEYVGFNQVFTLEASVNDPLYDRQWSIENTGSPLQYNGTPGADMSVDDAWLITTGSSSIKIAILDSGVDTLHEDLSNNLLTGFDGFADSISDTQGHPTPNFNTDGHGTSCAGIVAAEGDNGLGTAGISYNSKIIPVRIFYYLDYGAGIGVQATTNTDALLSGFSYAWRDMEADILSASAGLNGLFIQALGIDTVLINAELQDAHVEARNWKGIPMFFSSGNDNSTDILWPANLSTTIAIGASSMCDERKNPADCSGENWGGNYGEGLDVVAPGVKIAASDMMGSDGFSVGNYTNTFNGTSASCPNAAGVAALVLAVDPSFYAEDVRAILNITADRVSGYTYDSLSVHGTWNTEMGHGRVNADSAVLLAQIYEAGSGITEGVSLHASVYPNPTGGSVTVQLSDNQAFSLELTNLHGQVLLEKSELHLKETLDLHWLPAGIYVIRVHTDKETYTTRIVRK